MFVLYSLNFFVHRTISHHPTISSEPTLPPDRTHDPTESPTEEPSHEPTHKPTKKPKAKSGKGSKAMFHKSNKDGGYLTYETEWDDKSW